MNPIVKCILIIVVSSITSLSAMQKKHTFKQIETKQSHKPLFFNCFQFQVIGDITIYKFTLLDNHLSCQENNEEEGLAAALVTSEDTESAELIRLHVVNKDHRNKGYATILLKLILDYLATETTIDELGLLAEPMDEDTDHIRLREFYIKNGGQKPSTIEEFAGSDDVFIFPIKRKVVTQSVLAKL